ncbi:50S ribosome-binding GTPase [Popillia japonica]
MEYFDVDEKGIITTIVLVTCPTERIRKLVSGVSDGKLRQITESIQEDLQNTFHNFVRIKVVLEIPKQEEINK